MIKEEFKKAKKQIIECLQNGSYDSYLLESTDKELFMDVDVLIMMNVYGINLDDVVKVCPEVGTYQEILNKISTRLRQSNNALSKLMPDFDNPAIENGIIQYFIEENNLENTDCIRIHNLWCIRLMIPGFKKLFEICKNGIPEDFDKQCDRILKTKRNNYTIEQELVDMNEALSYFEKKWNSMIDSECFIDNLIEADSIDYSFEDVNEDNWGVIRK